MPPAHSQQHMDLAGSLRILRQQASQLRAAGYTIDRDGPSRRRAPSYRAILDDDSCMHVSGAPLHSAHAAVGIANPITIAIALNMSRMAYLHDKRSCGVLGVLASPSGGRG